MTACLISAGFSFFSTQAHEGHGKTTPTPKKTAIPQEANALLQMTGFAPISLLSGSPAHKANRFSFIVIADTQQGATSGGQWN